MALNPTNGSWWIVQIIPKGNGGKSDLEIPPMVVGGLFKSFRRKDLKYPPAAVGGITEAVQLSL